MRPSRNLNSRSAALLITTALTVAGCCENPGDDGLEGSGGAPASAGSAGNGTSGGDGGASISSGAAGGDGGAGSDLAPTHGGLISIQDISIAGAPQAGHGLTVQVLFTAAKPPSYEESPGQPTGCKGWVYDAQDNPPPPLTDQGVITISGLAGGPIECRFQGSSYVCPVHSGAGQATVTAGETGTAAYAVGGAMFSAADVGRTLRVDGAAKRGNDGAFPIVAVESSEVAVVVNPDATDEAFAATYVVLAGAGPVPGNPSDPIASGDEIVVAIEPGGSMAFKVPDLGPVVAGEAFELDDASLALLGAVPLDGAPMTLGCGGQGEGCGAAQGTIVRITSTDGDVQGASPFAMPPPADKQVEIQCIVLGGDGSITVPAEAMELLHEAHQASSISRIRTAFMREGVASATNTAPDPPNTVHALVGHGILGFTSP
ncbi:hypothetical protein BE08_45850 [Sorangium cellulosum]|uniref:Uncharacterized protein n=1 Tax=Sorangium cellulosum TaxID=56 RepID=A0A150PIZ6_SORCE|nr:hypothetical protein BE08_45850 [Sorangium cellulosum]